MSGHYLDYTQEWGRRSNVASSIEDFNCLEVHNKHKYQLIWSKFKYEHPVVKSTTEWWCQ